MQSAEKEALAFEPWAAGIALATLLVLAGVAGFTAWDRSRNASLEVVITPTAVGDTHYVTEPPGGAGPVGIKYQSRALDMVAGSDNKIRDSKLIRVGMDDSNVYALYVLEDQSQKPAKDRYYMKAGANDFIEVQAQ